MAHAGDKKLKESAFAGREVTFPMCAFQSLWQKYTTLLYSPGLEEWLAPLNRLECHHPTHARAAGGKVGPDGIPSSETSAYPANFNLYMATAFARLCASLPPQNGPLPSRPVSHEALMVGKQSYPRHPASHLLSY